MNGFICCTGFANGGKEVFIKADRIVLIERVFDKLRREFTRIEYEGGNNSFVVTEMPNVILTKIEAALEESH